MEYAVDEAIWSENFKIITDQILTIPGLVMFGHNNDTRRRMALAPHIHKGAEFLYLSNGSQKYYINDDEYIIHGNQVLVVAADTLHSTGTIPYGRYETLWFQLDIDAFAAGLGVTDSMKRLCREALHRMCNTIVAPQENTYSDLQAAFYELASSDMTRQLMGYTRFIRFIMHLIQCTAPTSGCSPAVQRVIAYIEENICTHLELETLAELAGLSLSGFKQKFRRETGITPREYINLQKIEKSKEYLRQGVPITETAFALDFSSSSCFFYLFRQMEDMSPSEYIKKQSSNPAIHKKTAP